MTLDIAGLIDDGHLKLDNICTESDWTGLEHIADYTRDPAHDNDQFARQVEVWLQSAEVYGLELYRWVVVFPRDGIFDASTVILERGTPAISRADVVDDGQLYAEENQERFEQESA
jgi:hypothetical protein